MPRNTSFYRNRYHQVIIGLMVIIFLMMAALGFVLYQMRHRPLPLFFASQPNGKTMELTSFNEPNLLADTILRWASKAATSAYTFDFYNYNTQVNAAKSYFTPAGWDDYLKSVRGLLNTIVANQLFVNGIVAGTPVIANQGPLPGKAYAWRVQIPFLVTYQSANTVSKRNFLVILTIVRIPTTINSQGIGIDRFVMV